MIKNIEISGFRGQSTFHSINGSVTIRGRNGAGKSSIREAICFALSGVDSLGTKSPTHLISQDADKTKVSITTSRSVISRTLSRKKSSTLTLEKGDTKSTLTQSEFENMLCSQEAFLSVFVPGAFMRLPDKTKHLVFNQLLPKMDRKAFLQEEAKVDLGKDPYQRIDFSRRPDLLASDFAAIRRKIQSEVDHDTGALSWFQKAREAALPPPPPKAAAYDSLRFSYNAWSRYYTDLSLYKERHVHVARAQGINSERASLREGLKREIEAITVPELPSAEDFSTEIQAKRGSLKHLPAKPVQLTVVESDHCPTCGQIVGTKHREQVIAENQKLVEAYRAELAKVEAENNEVLEQIKELEQKQKESRATRNDAIKGREKLLSHKASLEQRLRDMCDVEVPEQIPEPIQPAMDEAIFEDVREAEQAMREYEKKKAQVEQSNEQAKEAAAKVAELTKAISDATKQIQELQSLETAAGLIPEKEFSLREKSLELLGHKFVVGEDISLVDSRQIPYELLSTAEKLKADILICLKLNSLLPRKVNMLFIDNAELLDSKSKEEIKSWCSGIQVFWAYVDGSLDKVSISGEA